MSGQALPSAAVAARDAKGRLLPGHGMGRPLGSRNRLSEDFLATLAEDFAENGKEAIQRCRAEEPATYVRIVASLVPKELEIKKPLDGYSLDDIAAALEFVRAALAANAAGVGEVIDGRVEQAAIEAPD